MKYHKLMDGWAETKKEFQKKWNTEIYLSRENNSFWIPVTGTEDEVAMEMYLKDGDYLVKNHANLSEDCLNEFCEVMLDFLLISNVYDTANKRNAELPEEEAIDEDSLMMSYITMRQAMPAFNRPRS